MWLLSNINCYTEHAQSCRNIVQPTCSNEITLFPNLHCCFLKYPAFWQYKAELVEYTLIFSCLHAGKMQDVCMHAIVQLICSNRPRPCSAFHHFPHPCSLPTLSLIVHALHSTDRTAFVLWAHAAPSSKYLQIKQHPPTNI